MNKLPISLCLFTSTKGHFSYATYQDTLNHLSRQIPLLQFGALYAHIKVTPSQESIGDEIKNNLTERGFIVEKTVGDWVRGISHGQHYLLDQKKASRSKILHSQPFCLILEDDSTLSPIKNNLEYYVSQMIGFLENDMDIVSTRLIRKNDWDGGVPVLEKRDTHWFSENFDMQPSILRTRDFFLAHNAIEDNWDKLSHLQCELVLRLALDTLSRSSLRHMVWLPEEIHSVHLGVPDYLEIKKSLNL